MKKRKFFKKSAYLFLIFAIIFPVNAFVFHTSSSARSLEEIQSDIDEKENELNRINQELKTMQNDIEDHNGNLDSIQGEIPRIESEILLIEKTLEQNRLILQELKMQQELKDLEYEEALIKQDKLIKASYLSWKTGLDSPTDLIGSAQVKNDVYQTLIVSDGYGSLEDLVEYIQNLDNRVVELEGEVVSLNDMNTELLAKKEDLDQREASIMKEIDELSKSVLGVKTRKGSVQSQLDQYYSEQKGILDYEDSILNKGDGSSGNQKDDEDQPQDNSVDNQDEPQDEEQGQDDQNKRLRFAGVGRDLYQGHGVGLSQFGALGAALNGWDYKQILSHYYSQTAIQVYQPDRTIRVDGYGSMHIDKYVAGIAEVPTVACEDVGIQFDSSNIWRCWPREAIKAQAVAARTYAISRTQSGNSICTSTACQVYNGSENMLWAAEETAGEVILYQGSPIEAVYSSDNNQGWGTANNDTIWSNYAGDGSPRAYLRAAKDNDFAFRSSWSKYTWSTNKYTYEQIDQMLSYVNRDNNLSNSRDYVNGVISDIVKVEDITFSKDASGRVAKVILHGSNGKSRTLAGWLFKSIWNSWVYNEKPTGELDYIYSLTFSSYNQ